MGQIGYVEVFVDDLGRTERFYGEVFGWTFRPVDFPYPYVMVDLPAGPVPGLRLAGMTLRKEAVGTGRASSTVVHVMVEDLDVALAAVRDAGGEVQSPVMRIPAGPFAYVRDTEGNTIGVWQPTAPTGQPSWADGA